MNPNDIAPMVITVFMTVAVSAIILVRMNMKSRNAVGSAELREIVSRLERMEQAIDAMAVETERISEGQRFTTKLLSERAKEALPRQ